MEAGMSKYANWLKIRRVIAKGKIDESMVHEDRKVGAVSDVLIVEYVKKMKGVEEKGNGS